MKYRSSGEGTRSRSPLTGKRGEMVGSAKFEGRIKELVEILPDLATPATNCFLGQRYPFNSSFWQRRLQWPNSRDRAL